MPTQALNRINLLRLGHLPTSAFLRDDTVTDTAKVEEKLSKAVHQTGQVICTATTVFPFTLFPDTVTVDRDKITIANRYFYRVAEVISIRIADLLNVTADVGPFFGSLKLTSRFYDARKPYHVNWLWRSDALRLKRVLHGFIAARKEKIDTTDIPAKRLGNLLGKVGKSDVEESE